MRPATLRSLQLSILLALALAGTIPFHSYDGASLQTLAGFTPTIQPANTQLTSYQLFNHAGWSRMRTITLDNRLGTQNLTDYQVPLTINYTFSMETDFHDIRFADSTGHELPYYIDNLAYGVNATVYVKVPLIMAGFNTTLTMYYGNQFVGPASDGKATFDLYDDFEYLDDPANRGWTQYYPALGLNQNHAQTDLAYPRSGQRSLLTRGANTAGTNDTDTAVAKYDLPLTDNLVFEGYFYHNAVSSMVEKISIQTNNNASTYTIGASTPDNAAVQGLDTHYFSSFSSSQLSSSRVPLTPNQWNSFRIVKTSGTVQAFLIGQQVGPTVSDVTSVSGIFLGGAGSAYGPATQPWWFDDVRIRKAASPEPAASYGPGQLVPPDSAIFSVQPGQNVPVDVVQSIPALNLTMKLNITIPLLLQVNKLAANPVGNPAGLSPLGVFFTIFANETTILDARMRVQYTTSQATGLDENSLTPYTYNTTARSWTPLDNIFRDTTVHLVEGTVHHFSLFGVFSQLVSHAVPSASTCWYCTWWLWAGVGTAGAAGTGAFYRRNRRSPEPLRKTIHGPRNLIVHCRSWYFQKP